MRRAILYIRVSTLKQASEGISLTQQREELRHFAETRGYRVIETISDEGLSGAKANRPGYQKVLQMVRAKGTDAVVVYNLSRFSRGLKTFIEAVDLMNKKGVELLSLREQIDTKTANGRLLLNMQIMIAEHQLRQIQERTAEALRYKLAKGETAGGSPRYGFAIADDKVSIIVNREERAVIEYIRKLQGQGKSYAVIAVEMERKGIVNRRGVSRWSKQAVWSLMQSQDKEYPVNVRTKETRQTAVA